jgi:hypothetical protein
VGGKGGGGGRGGEMTQALYAHMNNKRKMKKKKKELFLYSHNMVVWCKRPSFWPILAFDMPCSASFIHFYLLI